MKKKLLSLISLVVLIAGFVYAAGETEVFTIAFNTKPATESTSGYFTLSEKQNWNSKYTGTYEGVSYGQGLNGCFSFSRHGRTWGSGLLCQIQYPVS